MFNIKELIRSVFILQYQKRS